MSSASRSPLIMLGAGGHAKVLLALARAAGHAVIGVCDPQLAQEGHRDWRGIPVLGGDEVLASLNPDEAGLINGIGQRAGSDQRQRFYERLADAGFSFPPLVHPFAWVDDTVTLGAGVQIMAGAILQPDSRIGENSIVNTGARIDHDCSVGAHVHIAPGATLCGGVRVGNGAFVAAGATVIQGLEIGEGAILGAGATLVRHQAPGTALVGAGLRSRPAAAGANPTSTST